MLRQNLELYDSYQRQIGTCDGEIESLLQDLAAKHALPGTALPPARHRQRHKNAPRFEIRSPLHQLSGVDLTQIDAIGPYTALRLIAEIGTDMTRWPSEKHFTSWLTLAPKNKITGGRLISSRTMPSANRAAAMLRMCAMSAGKTSTALGAFYRRLAYRIGKAKAITATARKLAILVYRVLRRDQFLVGGQASLKSRVPDARDEDNRRLQAKIGELLMENELLYAKVDQLEAGGPLARRRSKR